jgi:hypothetical protein
LINFSIFWGENSPKNLYQKIEKRKKKKKSTWCLLGGGWGWGSIVINCKSWVIIKMLCGWLFMHRYLHCPPDIFIPAEGTFSWKSFYKFVCQNEYLQV